MKNIINFTLIVFVYLFLSFTKAFDNESGDYDNIDHITIVRNEYNPNFFEIEIYIDNNKYNLPLDMTENQLLIASKKFRDIQSKSYSLISEKGVQFSNIKTTIDYSVKNCNNLPKKLTYLFGIEYSSYSYMSWFPLAKMFPKTDNSSSYHPFSSYGFSLTLTNDTHGQLNIGDHKQLKDFLGLSTHRSFFCPQTKGNKYWGCTIRGIVSQNINEYINSVDGMDAIDINDQMNVFNVNEKFHFDIKQRFFLVPFNFFLFIKNSSMKPFIESNQCKIIIDNDGIYMLICNKDIRRKLPDLNIVVLHWLMIFSPKELVEDIPNTNNVIYKIITHRKQVDWVIGQFFFYKYGAIFEENNDSLDIFTNDLSERAVVVYSYRTNKLSLDDYDLTDILIKDNRSIWNYLLCLMCSVGISFLIYVRILIIKDIKIYTVA